MISIIFLCDLQAVNEKNIIFFEKKIIYLFLKHRACYKYPERLANLQNDSKLKLWN